MKWENKEIKDLDNEHLLAARIVVAEMDNFRLDKINDPRFMKKFKNQPSPTINPAYLQLQQEINNEIFKRNL